MKKILITGANSYIGMSFENYINEKCSNEYIVDTIDMQDGNWHESSFEGYDTVFHVAGIAHQKESKKRASLYEKVNCDLAIEVAKRAKEAGVKQFVFLSSMSIYGMDMGVITRETLPNPKSYYGKSKLKAEKGILSMEDCSFTVCVLRPPMVYGKGCKGNFVKVKKIVEKFPIFPYVKNERSMIHIDNLSSFVKLCIDNNKSGVYFPQNKEYVSTTDLVKGISLEINKKIFFEYISGGIIIILRPFVPMLRKAFGTLIYEIDEKMDYCVVTKLESIRRSV